MVQRTYRTPLAVYREAEVVANQRGEVLSAILRNALIDYVREHPADLKAGLEAQELQDA